MIATERMRLSILIPAYHEEHTIAQVLERVLAIDTESLGFDKEVIVCDDGSSDDTIGQIRKIAATDPRVVVVCHPQNRGKGAAIRSALARASGDFTIIQDADLEYEVDDYPAILTEVKRGADVVYGSRFLARRWPSGMRVPNLIANRMLTFTANALFDLNITDEATCLKVFRTDLLRSLELECEGFEFCPEVTAKLGLRHVEVTEVPIRYTARRHDEGKKVRWTDGVQAMWVLAKHRWRGRR